LASGDCSKLKSPRSRPDRLVGQKAAAVTLKIADYQTSSQLAKLVGECIGLVKTLFVKDA
jgi:hypothetical protein